VSGDAPSYARKLPGFKPGALTATAMVFQYLSQYSNPDPWFRAANPGNRMCPGRTALS